MQHNESAFGQTPNRPKAEFNWRAHEPEDLKEIGGERDHARWHAAIKEDAEELMDRLAERMAGIDFTKKGSNPLLAMIAEGEQQGHVTREEAESLRGMYGPIAPPSVH